MTARRLPMWKAALARATPAALALCLAIAGTAPAAAQEITGAGSTLVHALLQRWSQAYLRSQRDAEFQPTAAGLDYEPVGSQAGIMRMKDKAVDFGASEVPLSDEEMQRYGLRQFPIAAGGIAVAVNLDAIRPARISLTPDLLADIYLGRVKTWSDPAIGALNPGLKLPDTAIQPVRRADGSGTTAVMTAFLARANPAWKSQVGEGLTVAWPVGLAAKGNDGVAEMVRATPNAVGYLDYGSARRFGLAVASLRNEAGAFGQPGPESLRAAASSIGWSASPGGRTVAVADAAAYPLVATTFVLMPSAPVATGRERAIQAFFGWALDNGAQIALDLGYVPLPAPTVEAVKTAMGVAQTAGR